MCILLSGAGFVLPYNSFIATVDYFHTSFPGTTFVFDISLTYALTALVAILLNKVIIGTFSPNSCIMFGYTLSLSLSSPITCPTLSAAPAYAEKELPGPDTYTYSVADDYSKSTLQQATSNLQHGEFPWTCLVLDKNFINTLQLGNNKLELDTST
jgi:hypothetical protein